MDLAGNVIWLSFLGGALEDKIACITQDGIGNYFVIGSSNAAWGDTIIRPYAGNREGFAAKVSASGSILWVSFFGGPSQDSVEAVAYSSAPPRLYLAGSSDLTWGIPILPFQGGTDAFVCQLDSSGNMLWNTFLGGMGSDKASGLTLDSSLNVYIAGASSSLWGSPLRSFTGGQDAFIARLNGSGNLSWNTFLGGSGNDNGAGIAIDGSGNIFATGTSSASWGTNIKRVFSGGSSDGFVAKLDSAGTLKWNTCLRSTVSDAATGLAVNTSGWIAVSGSSSEPWGDRARPYSANSDGYLAIMNA
jgi:hypothetical protein